MKPFAIVYVSDMGASVAFYQALGFEARFRQRNSVWTELVSEDTLLALHRMEPLPPARPSRVILGLLATERLERIQERLEDNGVTPLRGIADETFGRSILLEDPDGLQIQVSEHSSELDMAAPSPLP
jgi:predicted enzyme related to lactoylglutathione lyase